MLLSNEIENTLTPSCVYNKRLFTSMTVLYMPSSDTWHRDLELELNGFRHFSRQFYSIDYLYSVMFN